MGEIKFITHHEKKILHLDFAGCNSTEVSALINDAKKVIAAQPHYSLSVISDVTDMKANKEVTQMMKEFTAHNKPYVKQSAVLGITGIKKVLYQAVIKFSNRKITLANTMEEAKEYLRKDAE
ncbi:hypothetical protein [Candidatus Lokiarchaeum ossiferum]|uniref:hypothetical protein n=1 Tax=Candidatus Lokiarchaeum ossiferum TaxID=2951803 RepID=UPI00352C9332